MEKILEVEKKYLIKNVKKTKIWDKEHIVYQWYISREKNSSTKIKLIFDLIGHRTIFVRVKKKSLEFGKSEKVIEYLKFNTFSTKKLIGTPFVLKRRSILGKLFLDEMIRSNDTCKYLLEDEGNSPLDESYEIVKEVTGDDSYYNQNMCTIFTKEDNDRLIFLIKLLNNNI